MKLKRGHRNLLIGVVGVLGTLGVLYYRATIPFLTAQQFIKHIHTHQLDDAKSMLDQSDLDQLPEGYWNRLANTEFQDEWLESYTIGSLIRSTIGFQLLFPNGAYGAETTVQYYSIGQRIRVHHTEFK